MIRVYCDGKSVLSALSTESAEEYVQRHSPTLQKRMEIRTDDEARPQARDARGGGGQGR